MPPDNASRIYPKIVPQVGAILYLDSALDYPEAEHGSRHWLLSGSCVLVAPNKILTIGHALTRTGRHAAFFPFEGIVFLKKGHIRQFPYGDSLVLASLERRPSSFVPLPYWKVWKRSLQGEVALVGGFGDWKGIRGAENDGMQRLVSVELGLPATHDGQELKDGNLDISWWSLSNDGVEALLDNSGGPLLRAGFHGGESSLGVVGITRERSSHRQVCSWITADRDLWLKGRIGVPRWRQPREKPLKTHVSYPVIDGAGHVEHVTSPPGATRVKATVSATEGMRLQMDIRPAPEPSGFRQTLATDNRASGRFLVRDMKLDGQTKEVALGIVPVAQAPGRAEEVQAQLCCMFH